MKLGYLCLGLGFLVLNVECWVGFFFLAIDKSKFKFEELLDLGLGYGLGVEEE